jgi:hypothetical protein
MNNRPALLDAVNPSRRTHIHSLRRVRTPAEAHKQKHLRKEFSMKKFYALTLAYAFGFAGIAAHAQKDPMVGGESAGWQCR